MSVIVIFVAKTFVPIVGLMAAENYFLREHFPKIYSVSSAFPALELPRSYGGVIVLNVIVSGLFLVYLGTQVGAARTKFKEKALKDGDKDAEARYSYPKMYAEGFSNDAKMFNCVQRGHQHALETYTQFVALSLVGGLRYPLTTLAGGLLWHVSRVLWAEGYKTGEPSKRYQSWMAYGIWTSIIVVMSTAVGTAVSIMA